MLKRIIIGLLLSPFVYAQQTYLVETKIYKNNILVGHPKIIVTEEQTGEIQSLDQNGAGQSVKVLVSKNQNLMPQGILTKIEFAELTKNSKTLVANPQIITRPNQEGTVEIFNDKTKEKTKLVILVQPQSGSIKK